MGYGNLVGSVYYHYITIKLVRIMNIDRTRKELLLIIIIDGAHTGEFRS
jgi:hypothetical protein